MPAPAWRPNLELSRSAAIKFLNTLPGAADITLVDFDTDVRGQCHLGYASSNAAEDGAWRKVDVKVTRPDLRIRVRKGYFARCRPSPR
jgi:hypothetical protein